MDDSLGCASIIVNIADIDAQKEIEHLYASDADWNRLLPYLSEGRIDNQISLREFIQGFEKFPEELPIQNLLPALSAVIYKINEQEWHPERYAEGLTAIEQYEKIYYDTNQQGNTIVIVAGKKIRLLSERLKIYSKCTGLSISYIVMSDKSYYLLIVRIMVLFSKI